MTVFWIILAEDDVIYDLIKKKWISVLGFRNRRRRPNDKDVPNEI